MDELSIIIPVYNAASRLRECLDSVSAAAGVLSQKIGEESRGGEEVEIICVDDGSTDGSGEILDGWGREEKVGEESREKVKRVVIHQPNRGVSAARNVALEVATGEWVLFVDADDVIAPDCLVEILAAIRREPEARVVAWGENTDAALWSGLWNKAYHRSVLPSPGFRPYAHGEDRLFVAEVLSSSPRVARIGRALYDYRPSATSATAKPRDLGWILDTLGYSGEMLSALDRTEAAPARLYHEVAVWTLEECSHAMHRLDDADRAAAYSAWREFLPRIVACPRVSRWYRGVAWICQCGGRVAQLLGCEFPRAGKRRLK